MSRIDRNSTQLLNYVTRTEDGAKEAKVDIKKAIEDAATGVHGKVVGLEKKGDGYLATVKGDKGSFQLNVQFTNDGKVDASIYDGDTQMDGHAQNADVSSLNSGIRMAVKDAFSDDADYSS